MPIASAGPVTVGHYWPRHHDGYIVSENPPVLNQWYTVLDENDVEVKWLTLYQTNGENAAKNIEVRLTVDGVVYQATYSVAHGATRWVYRYWFRSVDAGAGLAADTVARNAAYTTMWRGQSFKFEVRITSAPGSNQWLVGRAVVGTDEVT